MLQRIFSLVVLIAFSSLNTTQLLSSPKEDLNKINPTIFLIDDEVEATADIPHSVDKIMKDGENTFFQMMMVLFGLIFLVFLTFFVIRRVSHMKVKQLNSGRTIKILEKRPLSPKSVLYLIEVGGKQALIAESQLDVRSLQLSSFKGKSDEEPLS